MGIFGAGRAFNLSFRPQPFGNPGYRRTPMPFGNFSQTTNVTIKNGPSGFWGFMGGLMSGLGLSPMGGLFGMMNPMMGFGGFNTGINSGVYGALNAQGTASPSQADREAREMENLKALYPDCKIGRPVDGKYYLTDKNGKAHSGTFEELAAEAMNKTQGQVAPEAKTKTDTETKVNPDANPQVNPKDSDNPNPTAQGAGNAGNADGAAAASNRSARRASGSRSPKGWYRANNANEGGNIAGLLTPGTTARQVLDKILKGKMDYLCNADRELLAQELIYNNPSIFVNGKVKSGADIGKFDIPSIQYIKDTYVESEQQVGNGRIQYTRKQEDKNKIQHGTTIRNDGNKTTIKGQNGYYAQKGNDGWHYYDPNGVAMKGEDFKKKCPNIYELTQAKKQAPNPTPRTSGGAPGPSYT